MSLPESERIARLRLFRSESVGPITFYRLLSRFGSAQKALEALPTLAQRGGKKAAPRIMTMDEAGEEIAKLHAYGGRGIVFGDADYPEWLSTIEDAPPVLSVLGDAALLSKPSVAIVGARNASANAKRFTHMLAWDLGKKGQLVVSGMARGIDTAAHQASLQTGTVAVLAGGIDQIYPTENTDLYKDIIAHGCVVSEMPFGTAPTAHHFPRQNRIVSGLSKGTVVVEASTRSGSLITARLAAEQGREVFAVPGFPGDPRAAGPNGLIQNGATLIQNADDVLAELLSIDQKSIKPQLSFDGIAEGFTPFDHANDEMSLTPLNAYESVMEIVSHAPMDVDELCRLSQVSIKDIQMTLLEMELAGTVQRHPGNRVSRVG